jgi:hypothetical protein
MLHVFLSNTLPTQLTSRLGENVGEKEGIIVGDPVGYEKI